MAVSRPSLVGRETPQPDLPALLAGQGINAVVISAERDLPSAGSGPLPDLALLDVSALPGTDLMRCAQGCGELRLPAIALVPPERLADVGAALAIDDFVVTPADVAELVARARRVLWRINSGTEGEAMRVGDLVINPASYEVSLKGRRVNLRFKEYELLLLLATNAGRVYTREALLHQIWGYDYYGGTRTVDVHVRRLRSKIEDAEHSFIETIWNVGYRFRA